MSYEYHTENNKEIQEFLFGLGYKWWAESEKINVRYLYSKFIVLSNKKILDHSSTQDFGKYLSNSELVTKLTTKMKTLRTEKVCITVETKELYDIVWGFLIGLGYRKADYGNQFRPKKIGDTTGYFFIWANPHDKKGEILVAGNDYGQTFDNKFNAANDMGAIVKFFTTTVENKPETKQTINPEVKTHSFMNQKIAIKVGNSQELSKIVQEFLFSKGYSWPSGKNFEKDITNYYKEDTTISNWNIFEKTLGFSPFSYYQNKGYAIFDASTQFGEIINLFSAPPVPEIKVKNDAGAEYVAKFKPDRVVFGCAEIANEVFATLNGIMKTDIPSYSKYITTINIGRGVFPPEAIAQICAHPYFGKGE